MRKTALIALLFVFCLALFACGSKGNFKEHIMAGEYLEAISDYQKYIYGTVEKESEAKSFLTEYLSDSLDKYLSGEISETEMENILTCIQKVDDEISIVSDDLLSTTKAFKDKDLEVKCGKIIADYFNAIREIEVGDNPVKATDLKKLKTIFPINGEIVEYPSADGEEYDAFINGCGDKNCYGKKLIDYEIFRTYSIVEENIDTQKKIKNFFLEHGTTLSPEWNQVLPKADSMVEVDCKCTFEGMLEPYLLYFIFVQSKNDFMLILVDSYTQGDDIDTRGGLFKYFIETSLG